MSTTTALRQNRYGARCWLCDTYVKPNEGLLTGSKAAGWKTEHLPGECRVQDPSTPAAQPEVGFYTMGGRTIRVQPSRKNPGRVYGVVFTVHGPGERPTWEYEKGLGMSVAHMTPLTAADAASLGLAHGHCIDCCRPLGPKDPHNATLSSLVAARIGYGETCAANNGWPFPKGVAAQRAFLSE